jgi:DNA-binding GntR family transcriptional regulator
MMNFAIEDVEPGERQTIAKRIARTLRDAIVWLELKPGDTISETDIAARFGVSRQPVREAFIQLADQGLLRIRPQRPTEVVRISVRDVMNARFVREALEIALVRKAASMVGDLPKDHFDDNLARQTKASQQEDYRLFHVLDDRFHQMIASLADAEFVWKLIDNQKIQMDRVRYLSLPLGTPETVEEHEHIADAILAGDGDRAEAVIRRHLNKINSHIHRIRALHSEFFAAD